MHIYVYIYIYACSNYSLCVCSISYRKVGVHSFFVVRGFIQGSGSFMKV